MVQMILLGLLVILQHATAAKYSTQFNAGQLEVFQEECHEHIHLLTSHAHPASTDHGIELLNLGSRPIPFIPPCNKCILRNLAIYKVDEKKINGTGLNDGQAFETTIVIDIEHYDFRCQCHMNPSQSEIEKAIKHFENDRPTPNCDEVSLPKNDKFHPTKFGGCFPKENENEGIANVDLVGRNISLVLKIVHSETSTENHFLHVHLNVGQSPEATCTSEGGDHDKTERICQCLRSVDFFQGLPGLLATNLITCRGDAETVFYNRERDSFLDLLSCDDLYNGVFATSDFYERLNKLPTKLP